MPEKNQDARLPAPLPAGGVDLASLFEDMFEGVQLLDSSLTYRYLNRAAAVHAQRPAADLIDRRMREAYPGVERTEMYRCLEAVVQDRVPQRMVNEFAYPDGTSAWFDLLMTPAAGGVMVLSVDVTEQKRIEGELRRSVAALELADRRKDELLTMLAHELRNPLAAMRSGMHVLRGRLAADDGLSADAAGIVDRQLRHLARLVDRLVDATRLTGGQTMLSVERIDLGRVVRDAVTDHAHMIEERGVTVEALVPDTPVWVAGDEIRLAQLLGNLLDNAGKFTPAAGKVSVRLGATGIEAVVTVHDTGIGIAEDALPFVFEPLFQADTSLERGGGLGLGLTVAKALAELHEGALAVASDGVGRGAKVELRIPRVREPQVVAHVVTEPATDRQPARVLIIEDNRDAAHTLGMVVALWGYSVDFAHTGPDGVDSALSAPPEIVLCDIGLPGMDGYAVARALRADGSTRHARLIAITGYGQEHERRQALDAGFDVHFAKPVDPERLRIQLEA